MSFLFVYLEFRMYLLFCVYLEIVSFTLILESLEVSIRISIASFYTSIYNELFFVYAKKSQSKARLIHGLFDRHVPSIDG